MKITFIAHGNNDPSVGWFPTDAKITVEDDFDADADLITEWKEAIASIYEIPLNERSSEGVWTEEEYEKIMEG